MKNDFIDFGKKIKILGNKYDAKNLNKFINQKSQNNLLTVSKNTIDLKHIDTPLL